MSTTKGKLLSLAKYAGFIDKGTQPHLIRAKNSGVLAFQSGGRTVFRRVVRHPGTAPRPFVAVAMASGQMALRDGLSRRVDDLSRAFSR